MLDSWVASQDKTFFDKTYVRRREQVVTDMALARLSRVFVGASVHSNIFYRDESGNRAETDGLILYDDIAIVIEAKAKPFSLAARLARPERLERDFGETIDRAFGQALRVTRAIRSAAKAVFTDSKGQQVVVVDGYQIRQVYIVTPILDPMDPLAVGLADARRSGLLRECDHWPWAVSLTDLFVVADVLDTPGTFLAYLNRRLRYNMHSDWFGVQDEMDLLDFFLRCGLYLDEKGKSFGRADLVQWQADTSELDRYYAAMARDEALPPKPIPRTVPEALELARTIDRTQVLGRTSLVCEILSLGEASLRALVDALHQLPARLSRRSRPQVVVFSRPGFGMSIWMTDGSDPGVQEFLLHEDELRKYEQKVDEWLSAFFILRNGSYELVRVVRNTTPWRHDPEKADAACSLRDANFARRVGDEIPGRNSPCPCGSGLKFKRCHGASRTSS